MADLSWFFETPGVGGVIAATVIASLIISYGLTIRWIMKGHEDVRKDR